MISDRKPALMPSMCGTVRRKPKLAPDAVSRMLLGPGVIDVTIAKSASGTSRKVSVWSIMSGLLRTGVARCSICCDAGSRGA